MNLRELRVATNQRSGVAYDSAALNDVLNEALAKLSLAADWPWLWDVWEFDTVADTDNELLPAGLRRIDSVNIGGYPGFLSSIDDVDAWDYGYSSPRRSFAVRGDTLYWKPSQAAGTAVAVRYVGSEDRLEDDADEPLLPAEYHDALVDFAAGLALERAGNLQRAQRLLDRYESWLRDMRKSARRVSGNVGRIRVRPGGGI